MGKAMQMEDDRWVLCRMGATLLLCALSIGCFSPTPQSGLACSESGQCPDGQMCVQDICVLPGSQSDGGVVSDGAVGAVCGDGKVEGDEECDDDNTMALDGCSSDCTVERGFDCANSPSACTAQPLCPAKEIVSDAVHASCKDYYDAGYRASGIYAVDVDGSGVREPFSVLCDMETSGGGWTIVVNNVADAVEPSGCLPRLATVDGFMPSQMIGGRLPTHIAHQLDTDNAGELTATCQDLIDGGNNSDAS